MEDILDICSFCEITHNGSLIIDDIEDNRYIIFNKIFFSEIRRNKKCVHILYGEDVSINAGNFIYFAPFLKLMKSKKFNDT